MRTYLPGSSDVRLADLPGLVPVAWHEAVALVRQVATLALASPGGGMPPPDDIWLRGTGEIEFVGVTGDRDMLVGSLSTLLGILLPESSPAELKTLASADTEVSSAEPEEFIEALTFFARPDDYAELGTLMRRVRDAREAEQRQAALQALTNRTRRADTAAAPPPVEVAKHFNWKGIAAGLAALLALALIVLAARWFIRERPVVVDAATAESSPPAGLAQRVQSSVASAAAFVQEQFGGEATPAIAGKGRDLVLPAPVRGRRTRTPGATTNEARTESAESSAPAPVDESGTAEVAAPSAPAAASRPPDSRVYSASDAEVWPPVIARQQMPAELIGGLPESDPGVLELLVGENGQVVTAKLVTRSRRYQDRMLISAAKAWRFRPATKDGHPVRYRLLMPITW